MEHLLQFISHHLLKLINALFSFLVFLFLLSYLWINSIHLSHNQLLEVSNACSHSFFSCHKVFEDQITFVFAYPEYVHDKFSKLYKSKLSLLISSLNLVHLNEIIKAFISRNNNLSYISSDYLCSELSSLDVPENRAYLSHLNPWITADVAESHEKLDLWLVRVLVYFLDVICEAQLRDHLSVIGECQGVQYLIDWEVGLGLLKLGHDRSKQFFVISQFILIIGFHSWSQKVELEVKIGHHWRQGMVIAWQFFCDEVMQIHQ